MVSGSSITSLKVEERTLSTLSAGQNELAVHLAGISALLDAFIAEVDGALSTVDEIEPVLGIVLNNAVLNVVTIALLITMLASESGRITSKDVSVTIRIKGDVGDGLEFRIIEEGLEGGGNEVLATRAVGLEVEIDLDGLSSSGNNVLVEASSGLLTLVEVADDLLEVLGGLLELTVNEQPGDPFVISRGGITSLEVEERTLSTLGAGQDDFAVDVSLLSAGLDAFIAELDGLLNAVEEIEPVLRIVSNGAVLEVVAVALLFVVLALEGRRIAGEGVGVTVGVEVEVNHGLELRNIEELLESTNDEVSAAGAEGFVEEFNLDKLSSKVFLGASSRLLTLVGIANELLEVSKISSDFAIDGQPGDPLVVGRGGITSLKVEERTLSTLSTGQDKLAVHLVGISALLNTFIAEVNSSLSAVDEIEPVLGIVLNNAVLNVVTIALGITVLALEGRRITSKDVSVTVRVEGNSGDGLELRNIKEGLEGGGDEVLTTRAVRFEVEIDLDGLSFTLGDESWSGGHTRMWPAKARAIQKAARIKAFILNNKIMRMEDLIISSRHYCCQDDAHILGQLCHR